MFTQTRTNVATMLGAYLVLRPGALTAPILL